LFLHGFSFHIFIGCICVFVINHIAHVQGYTGMQSMYACQSEDPRYGMRLGRADHRGRYASTRQPGDSSVFYELSPVQTVY